MRHGTHRRVCGVGGWVQVAAAWHAAASSGMLRSTYHVHWAARDLFKLFPRRAGDVLQWNSLRPTATYLLGWHAGGSSAEDADPSRDFYAAQRSLLSGIPVLLPLDRLVSERERRFKPVRARMTAGRHAHVPA